MKTCGQCKHLDGEECDVDLPVWVLCECDCIFNRRRYPSSEADDCFCFTGKEPAREEPKP